MGALKTSEQGDAVAGEGRKESTNDDRPVEQGAKIIVSADPALRAQVAPGAPAIRPHRPSQQPSGAPRRGGLWLVILVYLLSGGALAYAIYERFLAG